MDSQRKAWRPPKWRENKGLVSGSNAGGKWESFRCISFVKGSRRMFLFFVTMGEIKWWGDMRGKRRTWAVISGGMRIMLCFSYILLSLSLVWQARIDLSCSLSTRVAIRYHIFILSTRISARSVAYYIYSVLQIQGDELPGLVRRGPLCCVLEI